MKRFYIIIPLLIINSFIYGQVTTNRDNSKVFKSVYNTHKTEVETSTNSLQEQVNGIIGVQETYFLNATPSGSSFGYYTTSTTLYATPTTFTKTLSGTNIIISSWVVNLGSIETIPSGQWEQEIYAKISNFNDTRIFFQVYDGSGTAINNTKNLISGSNISSGLTTEIEEYILRFSTNVYIPRTRYLTVILKANESGANPVLSWYVNGSFDSYIKFPIIREEVSVIEVIAGTNLNGGGKGSVTLNLDPEISLAEVNLTEGATIEGKLTTKQITSGDAGTTGDSYKHFVDSDSWGADEGGAGGWVGTATSDLDMDDYEVTDADKVWTKVVVASTSIRSLGWIAPFGYTCSAIGGFTPSLVGQFWYGTDCFAMYYSTEQFTLGAYSRIAQYKEIGNGTYTFPVTDGNNGDVLTTNGDGVSSWVAPAGGNKNREVIIPAKSFEVPESPDNKSYLVKEYASNAFENITTTVAIRLMEHTDTSNHNFFFAENSVSWQWDDAVQTWYYSHTSSGGAGGYDKAWLNLLLSTAPSTVWYTLQSTVTVANCVNKFENQVYSTWTVTSTNFAGISDGTPVWIGVQRIVGDSFGGSVYGIEVKKTYVVD